MLALVVSSSAPAYSESLPGEETASSGLCTRAEVKGETCSTTRIKPDGTSATEGKLLDRQHSIGGLQSLSIWTP